MPLPCVSHLICGVPVIPSYTPYYLCLHTLYPLLCYFPLLSVSGGGGPMPYGRRRRRTPCHLVPLPPLLQLILTFPSLCSPFPIALEGRAGAGGCVMVSACPSQAFPVPLQCGSHLYYLPREICPGGREEEGCLPACQACLPCQCAHMPGLDGALPFPSYLVLFWKGGGGEAVPSVPVLPPLYLVCLAVTPCSAPTTTCLLPCPHTCTISHFTDYPLFCWRERLCPSLEGELPHKHPYLFPFTLP